MTSLDLEYYEQMVRIRYFEKEVERRMKEGYIHGTTHLCNGQEAVAVGVCSLLKQGDTITSTHRGHGHSLAFGASMNKMMAELFGKVTGYSKGKGGSMHIADVSRGNLGANGIVGGGIPIAVGAGLTAHMKKTDAVAICFFGDGATNEGSFHEALNLAAIWDLPVVFVCENNAYGMSSPIEQMVRIDDVATRAASYGFPGVTIDGNDLRVVRETTRKAIQRARKGDGPTLIEAKTYRYKGHSRSDQQLYRSQREVESHKKNDPIRRYEQALRQKMGIHNDELSRIQKAVQLEVDAAVQFAINSEEPDRTSLEEDVYA